MRISLLVFGGMVSWSLWAATSSLGEQVYQQACMACHAPVVAKALGASPAGDAVAWGKRFETAKAQSLANNKVYPTPIAYLIARVKQGVGAMPPGGNCRSLSDPMKSCSDEEYAAAIEFMSREQHAS